MSKIIGAHNAMTGTTAINLFADVFHCFCKCQDKGLYHLAKAGVTCYDLRFWFDSLQQLHWGHGMAEYSYCGYSLEGVLDKIQEYHIELNKGKPLYVRLILEHPRNDGRTLFRRLCKQVETSFPDIIFFEGRDKHTWEKLYTFKRENELPPVHEYHASVSGKGLYKIMPRRFWKKYGKDYELQEGINLIDFI